LVQKQLGREKMGRSRTSGDIERRVEVREVPDGRMRVRVCGLFEFDDAAERDA
jgi:limonene-1,2-epoxide hydrolase